MAITTLERAKAVLMIEGTGHDALIASLIPLVEEDYIAIRNADFEKDENGQPIYPPSAELTAVDMIGYRLNTAGQAGIQSETLGRHSVTFAAVGSAGYPEAITNKIKRCVAW